MSANLARSHTWVKVTCTSLCYYYHYYVFCTCISLTTKLSPISFGNGPLIVGFTMLLSRTTFFPRLFLRYVLTYTVKSRKFGLTPFIYGYFFFPVFLRLYVLQKFESDLFQFVKYFCRLNILA